MNLQAPCVLWVHEFAYEIVRTLGQKQLFLAAIRRLPKPNVLTIKNIIKYSTLDKNILRIDNVIARYFIEKILHFGFNSLMS